MWAGFLELFEDEVFDDEEEEEVEEEVEVFFC